MRDQNMERIQAVLSMKPIRADVRWEYRDNLAVITIKKNFSKFEKFLHRIIKGPEELRIPLDRYGTTVWGLCDGAHTIKQICDVLWERYHEEIEPVEKRVPQFIAMLRARGLIYFEHEMKGR